MAQVLEFPTGRRLCLERREVPVGTWRWFHAVMPELSVFDLMSASPIPFEECALTLRPFAYDELNGQRLVRVALSPICPHGVQVFWIRSYPP